MNRYIVVAGLSGLLSLGVAALTLGPARAKPESAGLILMLVAVAFSIFSAASTVAGAFMLTRKKLDSLNHCYALELLFVVLFLGDVGVCLSKDSQVLRFYGLISLILGGSVIAGGNLISWGVEFSRRTGLKL